ncbi:MAG TPA: hypothetical protein VNI84_13175 [Pyrinomonadaceae bacterium]|nr:hypothetical protein [Pyrinomonadaceae bacterium]
MRLAKTVPHFDAGSKKRSMPVITDFYELYPIVSVLIGELCLLACRHGCLITNISFSHRKINRFGIAGSPRAAQFYFKRQVIILTSQ